MKKSALVVGSMVLTLVLVACSEEPPVEEAVPEVAVTSAPPPPPEPETPPLREVVAGVSSNVGPWLNSHLPVETLAYLRIPSVWGIFATPKESMYHTALGSAPYTETLESIREGFGENVLPEVPADAQFLIELLLLHARSPIEVAVVPSTLPQAPFPDLLVGQPD